MHIFNSLHGCLQFHDYIFVVHIDSADDVFAQAIQYFVIFIRQKIEKNGIKRNAKNEKSFLKYRAKASVKDIFRIPCPPSWDFFGLAYICTLTPRNPQEHRAFIPFFYVPKVSTYQIT